MSVQATETDPGAPPPDGGDGQPDPTPEGGAGDGQPGGEDNPLEKALHAERQANKELKRQLKDHTDQAEQQRLASLSEQERAIEEARKQAREEALAETHLERVKAMVTAAAAKAKFTDPDDAVTLLNLADLEANEEAVSAQIAELAKRKPYLLVKAGTPPLEQGPSRRGDAGGAGKDWIRQALAGES